MGDCGWGPRTGPGIGGRGLGGVSARFGGGWASIWDPTGRGSGPVSRLLLAGLVATAAGLRGARSILGFSAEADSSRISWANDSLWLNPVAAAGNGWAFGVAYLGMASLLGVGMPLQPETPPRPVEPRPSWLEHDPASPRNVLSRLPTAPGVYLFKETPEGEILYVGKAKSLRPRVRSYFRKDPSHSIKTQELVRRVASLDTIVVGSEAEALILEANLIKEHHPRFNIQLRDDKKYPYIKVTTQEAFPRVFVTRNVRNDGSRYFGPFTSVGPLRQALEVVKRLYSVRSCRYDLPREAPDRPCLDYHIGRCLAPCVGLQSQEAYEGMIQEILRILDGETEALQE